MKRAILCGRRPRSRRRHFDPAHADGTVKRLLALKADAGLVALPHWQGDSESELVCVIDDIGLVRPYYLLMHRDMQHAPRVRAFADFVASEIKSFRALLSKGNPSTSAQGQTQPIKQISDWSGLFPIVDLFWEHLLDHTKRLAHLIAYRDELGRAARVPVGPEILRKASAASPITAFDAARIDCVER